MGSGAKSLIFIERDYQKWRSACLWPLAASSRRLSKESGRAGVQGAEVQKEGGSGNCFFVVCLFLQSMLQVHFLLVPWDQKTVNFLTQTSRVSLLSVLPILSLAPEKPGIWKSGTLALLTKLS